MGFTLTGTAGDQIGFLEEKTSVPVIRTLQYSQLYGKKLSTAGSRNNNIHTDSNVLTHAEFVYFSFQLYFLFPSFCSNICSPVFLSEMGSIILFLSRIHLTWHSVCQKLQKLPKYALTFLKSFMGGDMGNEDQHCIV